MEASALDKSNPPGLRGTAPSGSPVYAERAADHTLETSALINEAYLRLVDASRRRLAGPRALPGRIRAGDAAHPGRLCPCAKDPSGGVAMPSASRWNGGASAQCRQSTDLVKLDEALTRLGRRSSPPGRK